MNTFLGMPFCEPSTWALHRCVSSENTMLADAEVCVPAMDVRVEIPWQHTACCRSRLLLDSFVCSLHKEWCAGLPHSANAGQQPAENARLLLDRQYRARLVSYLDSLNKASELNSRKKESSVLTFKNQLPPVFRVVDGSHHMKALRYTVSGRIELRMRRKCEDARSLFPPLLAISSSDECATFVKVSSSSSGALLLLEGVVCLDEGVPLYAATYSPFSFEIHPHVDESGLTAPLTFDIFSSTFAPGSDISKSWHKLQTEVHKTGGTTKAQRRFQLSTSALRDEDTAVAVRRYTKYLHSKVKALMAKSVGGGLRVKRGQKRGEEVGSSARAAEQTAPLARIAVLVCEESIPVEKCPLNDSCDLSCVLPEKTVWPIGLRFDSTSVARTLSPAQSCADLLQALKDLT